MILLYKTGCKNTWFFLIYFSSFLINAVADIVARIALNSVRNSNKKIGKKKNKHKIKFLSNFWHLIKHKSGAKKIAKDNMLI